VFAICLLATGARTARLPRFDARRLLDNAVAWDALRLTLDSAFGLYRRRISLLRRWGVLDDAPSVLDVGCGIGQYGALTEGAYLGVDIAERYIRRAQRRFRHQPGREFRTADVMALESERQTFDIVLIVDLLHHLDDPVCEELLTIAARLSRRYVISFEPITEQSNRTGRWIVDHDRGSHVRSLAAYEGLLRRSPLLVERSEELHLGPITTRAVLSSSSGQLDSSVAAP
jgi:SAM-dependent methyltransferase